jgi:hypothetical protein
MIMVKIITILLISLSLGYSVAYHDDEPPPELEDVSLIASQFSADPYANQDKMELIVSGKFTLIYVHMTSDDDFFGDFCEFDFQPQKDDPSLVPRFIDIHETVHCQEHSVILPLLDVSRASRDCDHGSKSSTHSMIPSAFVFHDPESGSTLLTNNIVASQPGSRLISESSAVENVLACAECSHDAKLHALQEKPCTCWGVQRVTRKKHITLHSRSRAEHCCHSYCSGCIPTHQVAFCVSRCRYHSTKTRGQKGRTYQL